MFRLLAPCLIVLICTSSVSAQSWAEKMFNKTEHNFGTVIRGSDTVYRFEVTNLYKQDMHITGVRSSCGCTQPSIENPVIKTHEKGYIVARFNTSGTHLGQKGATVTVTFGGAFRAEVRLRVRGYIRGDVSINPGVVRLGTVDQGMAKEQVVRVNYNGRMPWKITDVTNDNDFFEVEVQPSAQNRGGVTYDLLVRLKQDVPPGYIKDQITLVTNDNRSDSQRIPLLVEGRIVPEISVTPAALFLGEVTPGQTVTKKLVVRGKTPFRITSIDCGGNQCFSFKSDDTAKKLHLVEVAYNPQDVVGQMQQSIVIHTEGASARTASCQVSANVLAAPQETTTGYRGETGTEQVADTASN